MKNYILTLVLAMLVVLASVSLRRAFAASVEVGSSTATFFAIGPSPLPPKVAAIGPSPAPLPPKAAAIGPSPAPLPPKAQ
jgi:hypothetical protein